VVEPFARLGPNAAPLGTTMLRSKLTRLPLFVAVPFGTPRSSPPPPAGTASSPSHRPPCSLSSRPAPALPANRESFRPVAPTRQSAPSAPVSADARPSAVPGPTTPPPTSDAAAFPLPPQSRLPPPSAPPPASAQTAALLFPYTSSASDPAPVAANFSASPGSIPARRSHAPIPAVLSLGSFSTTTSPADNSPPSARQLAPNSTLLSPLVKVSPPASVPAYSSLSSSTRPPLEASSFGDMSLLGPDGDIIIGV